MLEPRSFGVLLCSIGVMVACGENGGDGGGTTTTSVSTTDSDTGPCDSGGGTPCNGSCVELGTVDHCTACNDACAENQVCDWPDGCVEAGDETTGKIDMPAPCPASCVLLEPTPQDGTWLMHLADGALWRVSTADGLGTKLCDLDGALDPTALTFYRDNGLYASDGQALYAIDPCGCTSTLVGDFGPNYQGVRAITVDPNSELVGISDEFDLVRVEVATGNTSMYGPTGLVLAQHSLAWSEADLELYLADESSNALYSVDAAEGTAVMITQFPGSPFPAGLEYHPVDQRIYACNGGDQLYVLDPADASLTAVGGPVTDGIAGCNTLAAPWPDGGDICVQEP